MIALIHPTFLSLVDDVIISHAYITQISNCPSKHKKHQSQAVRQLLQLTMQQYDLQGILDEGSFPYYIQADQRRFVSFSHSADQVALIIAPSFCAIDIETCTISHRIAERHFHANEQKQLRPDDETARRILWRLKECYIKLYQDKLYTGMKRDFSEALAKIGDGISLIKDCDHHIYNHPTLNLTAVFR